LDKSKLCSKRAMIIRPPLLHIISITYRITKGFITNGVRTNNSPCSSAQRVACWNDGIRYGTCSIKRIQIIACQILEHTTGIIAAECHTFIIIQEAIALAFKCEFKTHVEVSAFACTTQALLTRFSTCFRG